MDTTNISDELAKVPVGFLPLPLFNQIARLGVLAFIELVALRLNNGAVEVLLTKRDSDDSFWADQYHNPGTVLRPMDDDYSLDSAFNRLYADEYMCEAPSEGPFFSGFYFEQLNRGKGFGIVNWMELSACNQGEYFSVDDLPENLIKGQKAYIQKCASEYVRYKNSEFTPVLSNTLVSK